MSRRIDITLHALSRFRERRPFVGDDTQVRAAIGQALNASTQVQLTNPYERARKTIANNGAATYHQYHNIVLVMSNDAIVSVYLYEPNRWEKQ